MVATPAAGKIVRWFREPLIKSSMSRVLTKMVQIQGDATLVVSSIRSQGAQRRRWAIFVKTRMGFRRGFAKPIVWLGAARTGNSKNCRGPKAGFPGGLLCCKASEGERPFAAPRALHPIPVNRTRGHVGLDQRFLRSIKRNSKKNQPRPAVERYCRLHAGAVLAAIRSLSQLDPQNWECGSISP